MHAFSCERYPWREFGLIPSDIKKSQDEDKKILSTLQIKPS